MTLNILFAAGPSRWAAYQAPLTRALDGLALQYTLHCDHIAPSAVDYIVYAPDSTLRDFSPYTRCKAVLNIWAGVEQIIKNQTLTQPLCRMVDPALTAGMVEYVCAHVLRYHVGLDATLAAQTGTWVPVVPPLASERPVTVLGLGTLGTACAKALVGLGFPVSGWSRRDKTISGITCYSGVEGLTDALSTAEIVVTLLPQTPETTEILNSRRLSQLPRGACLINPGRGPLIEDAALIAALKSGQIAHATLDVFRTEPLPAEHPFWAHPKITVTPHVASETRPSSASQVIAANIARCEAGHPLLHQVDLAAGY
jgi:glyoxylate/hydroxypyruvate reductase A